MRYIKKKASILFLFTIVLNFIGSVPIHAEVNLSGYENPKKIIIASPKNNYETTGSKISILGACDYNYPLYLNGEEIEVTEHGFFTVYVDLEMGKNTFTFTNNIDVKEITITRVKSSSSGGSSKETKYTNDVYGVLNKNYGTRRAKPSDSETILTPLASGTAFRILGETGSYYKLADGTYLAKDKITIYNKKLADNKVSSISIYEDTLNNMMVTKFKMNVNTLYSVNTYKDKVVLTLYDTISAATVTTPSNDTIKNVILSKDSNKKTAVYTINLKDNTIITGYDVVFKDGYMYLGLKKAPVLEKKGSLKGVTIVIDAGHGDDDNGALGPMGTYGATEKDINLIIAKIIKNYLEKLGAKVIMIRNDDTFYSLYDRVNIIKNSLPDLSVSIHGNSLAQTSDYSASSGFLTFYSYDLFNGVPKRINDYINDRLGYGTIRTARYQNLALTRIVNCPSVLLETSFLSNPNDYEFLINQENQKMFGELIGEAIKDYIESIAIYNDNVKVNKTESYSTYVVKKGDTLSSIAKKYNIGISVLTSINNLKNINYIYVGQKLLIPKK